MNGEVKIKSKTLIKGDTLRLFFVSVFSFVVRRGVFALWFYCIVSIIQSEILNFYLEKYNDIFVYAVVLFDILFVSSILMLFISAVKLGEQFLYFIKASGGKGRFLLLFHFFSFERSFKALSLYFKLTVLKTMWLVYFSLPCVISYGITFYLYSSGSLLPIAFYSLIAGSSLLLALCVFMWRISFFRYNAAPYYICLNPDLTPKEAIRKSVHFTDGFLKESVLLESSFFGWFLSCVAVVPLVYVLPYFKISKALFVVESLSGRAYSLPQTQYAVNYLRLK